MLLWIFQLTRSRGAWHSIDKRRTRILYFNSHAHVERDYLFLIIVSKTSIFQLTRSRGAWLEYSDSRGQTGNFNSHAHVERDASGISQRTFCIAISTHTLTWSVTLLRTWKTALTNFNSHAHVERDLAKPKTIKGIEISTHTLTWSVTYATRSPLLSWLFQLTRSRGAWLICGIKHILLLNFNSHAHVERDG